MVIDRLRRRQPVEVTLGTQARDFIYAPDASDLLVRLLSAAIPGAFNVATGRGATVRYVVEYLAARLGGTELLQFGARETSVEEPPHLVADMTKVATLLGWAAPTRLESGLDRILSLADAD
jgi:dTDP-6-deoxy-L-talose 4-dehydrogenase (NAD+)